MIHATARFITWTFFLTLVVCLLGLGALLYHPSSLVLLSKFLNRTTQMSISIGEIEGRLASDVTLTDLHLHFGQATLEAQTVHLKWQPLNLLIGRLSIDTFEARNATFTDLSTHASEVPTLSDVSWHLPLQLEINHIQGSDIHYVTNKHTHDISDLLIEGHFDSGIWYIDDFSIMSSIAQASGTAIVESRSLGLTFSVEHFDPFTTIENWYADTRFSGHLFISSQSKHLELSKIQGTWMDKNVQGHFRARNEENTISWDGFIDVNENHFSSEGRISDVTELSWLAYAPNLGSLLPNAEGHFFSEGILSESLLMANFDIDKFQWGRFEIANFNGELEGSNLEHTFHSAGEINGQDISFTYQGSAFFNETIGMITNASINSLSLVEPVDILFTQERRKISRASLADDTTVLNLDFDQDASEWVLNIDAKELSLEILEPFLPSRHYLMGTANFDISVERNIRGQLSGYANMGVENGEWEWSDEFGRQYDFPLESLELDLRGTDDLIAHLTVDLSDQNSIDGQLVIDAQNSEDWRDAPIEGIVTVIAADLDAVRFIAPSLELLSGQVVASFELGGTLMAPDLLESHAVLNDVSIPLTDTNTVVYLEEMILEGLPDEVIHLEGKGLMGDGVFNVNGVIDLTQKKPRAAIKIQGNELLLINTSEYQIYASPDLKFNHTVNGSTLYGKVQINRGSITLDDRASARRLSDDVVIINRPKSDDDTNTSPVGFSTHIALEINNPIAFSGFGLTSNIVGSLRLDSDPSQDYTKADGRVSLLDGEYKAFGKTFTVRTGDIIYNGGPARNPVVDIRAERSVTVVSTQTTLGTADGLEDSSPAIPSSSETKSILVGLALKGPLRQPHISFYSEPTMTDGDIVSYLFIGRPQDQASGAQADVLFQAVSELMPFTGSSALGEKFGLDELSLTQLSSNDGASDSLLDTTALVVGKRLSNRLYVRYIRGLSNTIDTVTSDFQVRLFLGKHFTLEGNADSNGYGGDLIYSIDRP